MLDSRSDGPVRAKFPTSPASRIFFLGLQYRKLRLLAMIVAQAASLLRDQACQTSGSSFSAIAPGGVSMLISVPLPLCERFCSTSARVIEKLVVRQVR